MKMTTWVRSVLAARRQRRELVRRGYEEVSEPIMALRRGGRGRERIVAVEISTDGHGLYVLTDKRRDEALMVAEYVPRPEAGSGTMTFDKIRRARLALLRAAERDRAAMEAEYGPQTGPRR